MREFQTVSFNEFKEIVDTATSENENTLITKMLRVLPDLDAKGEIELVYVLNNLTEENFNSFRDNYKNKEFYDDASGDYQKKNYWELTLDILEKAYNAAKNSNDKSAIKHHIINSKDLRFKKDYDTNAYKAKKLLFLKNERHETSVNLMFLESFIAARCNAPDKALAFLISYMNEHPKDHIVFFNNFYQRCRILDKDTEITHLVNQEFNQNLEKFLKQFFIE